MKMYKYESKKNPGTFILTDEVIDPKTKTLFVVGADGKERNISVATLKRWWTKIGEVEEAEEPATAETAAPEFEAEIEAPEFQAGAEAPEFSAETETSEAAEEAEAPAPTPAEKAAEEFVNSELVRATETTLGILYRSLNDALFLGELPEAEIHVCDRPRGYKYARVAKTESLAFPYRIDFGAGLVFGSMASVATTLLHQMVHIFCMEEDIADTCQKGRYHNGLFRKECEERGLVCAYTKANGWTNTIGTPELDETLKSVGLQPDTELTVIPVRKK